MEKRIREKKGGVQARLGHNFSKEIEEIKDNRLKSGKSKERISTEKITNLIVKHKLWKEIKKDINNATQEEVEEHGI